MIFLFGIIFIYFIFKTLNFNILFILIPYFSLIKIIFFNCQIFILDIISFSLFFGAVGKSAQIGLHA
jgi:NADH-quinone oxidoreductase subunit L